MRLDVLGWARRVATRRNGRAERLNGGDSLRPVDSEPERKACALSLAADRRVCRATWALVGLGLAVRLVRYLVVYPIWHDEAFLAVNFLDRGYLDLLRPLDYSQVSPVLFLWIELTAVRLLGFSEWSLRLFPALCGLASVLLFRHVAARLLRGLALVLAVGIFATAFYPIRHAAEVKPYASDLFSALSLLCTGGRLVAVARPQPLVVAPRGRRAVFASAIVSGRVHRRGFESCFRAETASGQRRPVGSPFWFITSSWSRRSPACISPAP